MHALLVRPTDPKQAVQVPADLAAALDERRLPLGRAVRIVLGVTGALDNSSNAASSFADNANLASPVSTYTFHGCVLLPDGAREATARMSLSNVCDTDVR